MQAVVLFARDHYLFHLSPSYVLLAYGLIPFPRHPFFFFFCIDQLLLSKLQILHTLLCFHCRFQVPNNMRIFGFRNQFIFIRNPPPPPPLHFPPELLFFYFSSYFFFLLLKPRSGELRTQKLKSHLMRTQSLKILPLKPGVGQYIAIHATLIARDFYLSNFYPSGLFTCIFSEPLPSFSCVSCG